MYGNVGGPKPNAEVMYGDAGSQCETIDYYCRPRGDFFDLSNIVSLPPGLFWIWVPRLLENVQADKPMFLYIASAMNMPESSLATRVDGQIGQDKTQYGYWE